MGGTKDVLHHPSRSTSVPRADGSAYSLRSSVTVGVMTALVTRNNGKALPDY